jgi:hypothetical protein
MNLLNKEEQFVLQKLDQLLRKIGSANDAEDHGYKDDVEQMYNSSL